MVDFGRLAALGIGGKVIGSGERVAKATLLNARHADRLLAIRECLLLPSPLRTAQSSNEA